MWRNNSHPSISGRLKSSRVRSGISEPASRKPSRPFRAISTSYSPADETMRPHAPVQLVVFDQPWTRHLAILHMVIAGSSVSISVNMRVLCVAILERSRTSLIKLADVF